MRLVGMLFNGASIESVKSLALLLNTHKKARLSELFLRA
jgi:hypothetical protein